MNDNEELMCDDTGRWGALIESRKVYHDFPVVDSLNQRWEEDNKSCHISGGKEVNIGLIEKYDIELFSSSFAMLAAFDFFHFVSRYHHENSAFVSSVASFKGD